MPRTLASGVRSSRVNRGASARLVGVDEGEDLGNRFLQQVRRQAPDAPRIARAPVEALELIRQDCPYQASRPLGFPVETSP
jgi:hypothetical protein